jgi:hypothetical protein
LWVESAPAAEEEEQLLCPWIWCFLKLLLRLLGKFHNLRSWRTCCYSMCFFLSICLISELGFWAKSIPHLFDPCYHKFLLGRGLEKQIKWYLIGLLLLPQITWLVFIFAISSFSFPKTFSFCMRRKP